MPRDELRAHVYRQVRVAAGGPRLARRHRLAGGLPPSLVGAPEGGLVPRPLLEVDAGGAGVHAEVDAHPPVRGGGGCGGGTQGSVVHIAGSQTEEISAEQAADEAVTRGRGDAVCASRACGAGPLRHDRCELRSALLRGRLERRCSPQARRRVEERFLREKCGELLNERLRWTTGSAGWRKSVSCNHGSSLWRAFVDVNKQRKLLRPPSSTRLRHLAPEWGSSPLRPCRRGRTLSIATVGERCQVRSCVRTINYSRCAHLSPRSSLRPFSECAGRLASQE